METDRWKQIEQLCHAALERKPGQQAAFLDVACAGDEALRREVDSLLAYQKQAAQFIEAPPLDVAAKALAEEDAARANREQLIGRRIGAYQIVGRIGVGGMGEVYRAFRADDQYKKEVAIKLVRAAQDSGFVISRFKNERQILAALEHPNIARLFDGGTTEEGVPYFVMELIEGESILEYCDSRKLSTTERLRLFLQVCSAVQYAHQRLIIHRDIKPSNILVTVDGVPKLLDFGIARIMDSDAATGKYQQTLTVFRVLTPGYASPEQVKGEPITTASDVYSLGVVLYELLTGRSPYRITDRAPQDISRAVCEFEPEKPSTVVRQTETQETVRGAIQITPEVISAVREGPPEKLSKRLDGDLDNIVLMALRKEPKRRYTSVEQFAEDLRRHLANLPVIARKDTVGYRASKFIARHKAGVAAAVVVAVTLLVGIVVTVREARVARAEQLRAQAQQLRAEKRFDDVRKLANSLIFEIHDSIGDLPGSTPARKLVVEKALLYLDSLSKESGSDPSLQRELAAAYRRVAAVQGNPFGSNLGDTQGAIASYRKAAAIWESLAKANPDSLQDQIGLAGSHRLLAAVLSNGGDPSALAHAQEAVAISEQMMKSASSDPSVLSELSLDYEMLASIQDGFGDSAGALVNLRSELTITEIRLKSDPQNRNLRRQFGVIHTKMGDALATLGNRDEALQLSRDGLDTFQSLAADPTDARSRRELAFVLARRGDILMMDGEARRALQCYRQEQAILEPLAARDAQNALLHLDLGSAYTRVGITLGRLRKRTDGLAMLRRAIPMFEQDVARDPSYTEVRYALAFSHIWIGEVLASTQNFTEASETYKKGLAQFDALVKLSPKDTNAQADMAAAYEKIGNTLVRARNTNLASAAYHKGMEIAEPLSTANPPNEQARYTVADIYFGLGELSKVSASTGKRTAAKQIRNWTQARAWYKRSLDAWHLVHNPGVNSPNGFECGSPMNVTRAIALCDSALAKLGVPAQ